MLSVFISENEIFSFDLLQFLRFTDNRISENIYVTQITGKFIVLFIFHPLEQSKFSILSKDMLPNYLIHLSLVCKFLNENIKLRKLLISRFILLIYKLNLFFICINFIKAFEPNNTDTIIINLRIRMLRTQKKKSNQYLIFFTIMVNINKSYRVYIF